MSPCSSVFSSRARSPSDRASAGDILVSTGKRLELGRAADSLSPPPPLSPPRCAPVSSEHERNRHCHVHLQGLAGAPAAVEARVRRPPPAARAPSARRRARPARPVRQGPRRPPQARREGPAEARRRRPPRRAGREGVFGRRPPPGAEARDAQARPHVRSATSRPVARPGLLGCYERALTPASLLARNTAPSRTPS